MKNLNSSIIYQEALSSCRLVLNKAESKTYELYFSKISIENLIMRKGGLLSFSFFSIGQITVTSNNLVEVGDITGTELENNTYSKILPA